MTQQVAQGLSNIQVPNLSNLSTNLPNMPNMPNMPQLPNKLFTKNLHDLIKGLRAHKDAEAQYVADCLAEIKEELKSDSNVTKANAVAKLTYVCVDVYEWLCPSFFLPLGLLFYVADCLGEMPIAQEELNLDSVVAKANAVAKLAYECVGLCRG